MNIGYGSKLALPLPPKSNTLALLAPLARLAHLAHLGLILLLLLMSLLVQFNLTGLPYPFWPLCSRWMSDWAGMVWLIGTRCDPIGTLYFTPPRLRPWLKPLHLVLLHFHTNSEERPSGSLSLMEATWH